MSSLAANALPLVPPPPGAAGVATGGGGDAVRVPGREQQGRVRLERGAPASHDEARDLVNST